MLIGQLLNPSNTVSFIFTRSHDSLDETVQFLHRQVEAVDDVLLVSNVQQKFEGGLQLREGLYRLAELRVHSISLRQQQIEGCLSIKDIRQVAHVHIHTVCRLKGIF